jgi:transcriptional antiterminator NusG
MAEMEKDQSELMPGDESEIEEPTSTTSDAVEESVVETTEGEMDEIIEGKEVIEEAQADLEAIVEEESLDEATVDASVDVSDDDETEVVAEAEEPVEAKASIDASVDVSVDDEAEVVAEVEEPAESEDEPEAVAEVEDAVEVEDEPEVVAEVEEAVEVEDEPEVVVEVEEAAESEDEPEVVAEVEEAAEAKASIDASVDASADDDSVEQDEDPEDDRHWYVVHCYSGYENKVRHNLEQRIETMGMKSAIFDVVVPTEEEIEIKDGKKRTVERRVFPGYILVQMILSEESWYVVRNTPGVTGFVGMGNEPTPLRPEEVASIVKRMEAEAPRIKVTYSLGQKVRIIDGPFNDFIGTVDNIDMERAKVRVMVSFFGRDTPVELDFLQVEKA